MENYQFDEQIMNQGWSKMNDLLDKEMPVQKKRRVPFIWWWSGASLSIAAALLLLVYLPNQKNNGNKFISKDSEMNQNHKKEKENVEKNKQEQKQNISHESNFFDEKPIVTSESEKSKNFNFILNKSKIKNSYSTENQTIESSFEIIKSTVSNAKDTEKMIENQGSPSQEKQSETAENPVQKRAIIANLEPLTFNPKKPNPIHLEDKDKIFFSEKNIKKINYLQANNLKIGIFASLSNGFNAGVTLKKTWQKHNVSASLFWEKSSKTIGIYRTAIPVIIDSMTTFPVVYPYGNINLAKDNSGQLKTNLVSDYLFILKTNNLCIGLEHNYRFTKRWESTLGVEYLRELGNRSYGIATVQESNTLTKSKEISEVKNTFAGAAFSADMQDYGMEIKSQAELQNIDINKNVFYLTAGVSYYFTKNLKFSGIYRQGLNSVSLNSPIIPIIPNNAIALKLTYYLPLKK